MDFATTHVKTGDPSLLAHERLVYYWISPHQRIVQCFNIGKTPEELGSEAPLLLAKAPNGDLEKYLQNHFDAPLRLRARWGLQLAEGIAWLHEKGIVWADCRPANMLLMDDLSLVLCDFGNAGMGGFESRGAPPYCYCDPTQGLAGGFSGKKSVDIYAFGCVFLEILTYNADFLMNYPELTRGGLAPNGQLLTDIIAFAPFKRIIENCWDGTYSKGGEVYDAMKDAWLKFEETIRQN